MYMWLDLNWQLGTPSPLIKVNESGKTLSLYLVAV